MNEALEKLVRGAMSGRFGENFIPVGEAAQDELATIYAKLSIVVDVLLEARKGSATLKMIEDTVILLGSK